MKINTTAENVVCSIFSFEISKTAIVSIDRVIEKMVSSDTNAEVRVATELVLGLLNGVTNNVATSQATLASAKP